MTSVDSGGHLVDVIKREMTSVGVRSQLSTNRRCCHCRSAHGFHQTGDDVSGGQLVDVIKEGMLSAEGQITAVNKQKMLSQ